MLTLNLKLQNFLNTFRKQGKKISIIKHLVKPPYGGGNQFILALMKELRNSHLVFHNYFSNKINTYLFDSLWLSDLEIKKLLYFKKKGAKIIHRIDGPQQIYRMQDSNKDQSNDNKLYELNKLLANTTIIQSNFAREKFDSLGFKFINPKIIHNASDNSIFFPNNKKKFFNRKVKLISTSWSSNVKKGQKIFEWIDKNLDFKNYEYNFIGRVENKFNNINVIPPLNSQELSEYLRNSDIFIFASQNETCSNSLIEALTCGLPTLFLDSGSNNELVKKGGISFKYENEIPHKLKKIINEYLFYKDNISIENISKVAKKYSQNF